MSPFFQCPSCGTSYLSTETPQQCITCGKELAGADVPLAEEIAPDPTESISSGPAEIGNPPKFPKTVIVAGTSWCTLGVLILIGTILGFLVCLPIFAAALSGRPVPVCFGVFFLLVLLFGAAIGIGFLKCGAQSLSGEARNMAANGLGSILIGLLGIPVELVVYVNRESMAEANKIPVQEIENICMWHLSIELAFILSGVLALCGHKAYRNWRSYQQKRLRP
jgi:hypothetical protein